MSHAKLHIEIESFFSIFKVEEFGLTIHKFALNLPETRLKIVVNNNCIEFSTYSDNFCKSIADGIPNVANVSSEYIFYAIWISEIG